MTRVCVSYFYFKLLVTKYCFSDRKKYLKYLKHDVIMTSLHVHV